MSDSQLAPDEGAFSFHPDFPPQKLRRMISGREFRALAQLMKEERGPVDWTPGFIAGVHGRIFGEFFPGRAGVLRKSDLTFGKRAALQFEHVENALTNLGVEMRETLVDILKPKKVEARTEQTFLAAATHHAEMIRIHPFIDGNGRWARIITSIYLRDSGLESGTIIPSRRKKEYIDATDRAIDEGECGRLAEILLDGYLEQSARRNRGNRSP